MPGDLPFAERIHISPPGRKPSGSRFMLNKASWGFAVLVTSRQTASIDPRMNILKTAFSVSGMTFPFRLVVHASLLDAILQPREFAGPKSAVLGRPAVVDDLDRHHVEVESALAAGL